MLRLIYYFQVEDDRRILGTFCEQASSLAPIFAKTEFLYILSFSTNHFPMYFNATFSLVDGTSYTISMVFMVQSCFTSLRKIIKYFEVVTINSFSHAKDASSSQIKRNRWLIAIGPSSLSRLCVKSSKLFCWTLRMNMIPRIECSNCFRGPLLCICNTTVNKTNRKYMQWEYLLIVAEDI